MDKGQRQNGYFKWARKKKKQKKRKELEIKERETSKLKQFACVV